MSLSLGQSESYINKIENKKSLPSMTGFFYICEHLNVPPKDFFNDEVSFPTKLNDLINESKKLLYYIDKRSFIKHASISPQIIQIAL